jgi:2-iminobutanoate/2-iminopropanoate deaminase
MEGPFSQGASAARFVFVSGQLPLDPATGELVEGGIGAQCEQAIRNCEAVLADVNLTLEDVAKVTIFTTNMAYLQEINAAYEQHFARPYPARTCVCVAGLTCGAQLEIECIAVR